MTTQTLCVYEINKVNINFMCVSVRDRDTNSPAAGPNPNFESLNHHFLLCLQAFYNMMNKKNQNQFMITFSRVIYICYIFNAFIRLSTYKYIDN